MDPLSAVEPPQAAEVQKAERARAFAELACEQHATVASRQLMALGFSRHEIAHMAGMSQIRVVHRGVYAVGPAPLTRQGRWMAAVLAAGPGAVLSHRSAAAAWGLISADGREVELLAGRSIRRRKGIYVRFARLPADEVTTLDGIPVTTVSRTILDLAGVVPRERVERAMHEIEIRRLLDTTSISALITRHPNQRGVGTLKAILADHLDAPTRNDFEALFLTFLTDSALPRPLVNHQIPHIGECDFVWPEARVVVELDGYATHGTRRSFEADRARDRALHVAGWRVIRITWRQLRDDPRQLANDLRTLLNTV